MKNKITIILIFTLLISIIIGCPDVNDDSSDSTGGSGGECIDLDGDTYGDNCAAGPDCNDGNAAINPGAAELCDGFDNNCDGDIDETSIPWYADCDNDNYASLSAGSVNACSEPAFPYSGSCLFWTSTEPTASEYDYDDDNIDVYPGQEAYFSTGYGVSNDDFDYNCDDSEEQLYGLNGSIPYWDEASGTCMGGGFIGAVPDCGDAGFFRLSVKTDPACTTGCECNWGGNVSRTQECR